MTISPLPDLPIALYTGSILLLAYLVRGIAGFGSGLIAVPLLTLVSPVTAVVPLVVSLDYLGSASQGLKNQSRIAWREQLTLVPFMVVGVAAGLYVFRTVPAGVLAKILGGFVIAFAVYQMLPLPPLRGSWPVAACCGWLGGLVGTLFGTGGPFYAIYFNLRQLEKSVFRATFATNFLIEGGIRLGAYALMGLLGPETLLRILMALPVVAVGLYAGGRIHTEFSQRAFVRFISLLLLASGMALLLRG